MYSDISQSSTLYFCKTYIVCNIWSEIAIRKGSTAPTTLNGDCSTLQTSKPNHPTTYTYTNTHTNNSQSMHACMHPFIHSFIHSIHHIHSITLSQERTKHYHCNSSQSTIIHPSIINHALHGPLSRAVVHERMMLPWLAHNGTQLHAHTACQPPPYTDTYIHLSLIHIWRCRRWTLCRSRWSPYH